MSTTTKMKTATLYLALLHLAPLALSAPMLTELATSGKPQGAAPSSRIRWKFGRPKFPSTVRLPATGDDRVSGYPPPHPIDLVFLHSPRPGRDSEPELPFPEPQRREDVEDMFELTDMDLAIAIPTAARPCQHARASREHNDVLVVVLAVAFLLIVLTVETWGSLSRSVRRILLKQGAIRLDEETPKEPLSIQACTDDGDDDQELGNPLVMNTQEELLNTPGWAQNEKSESQA